MSTASITQKAIASLQTLIAAKEAEVAQLKTSVASLMVILQGEIPATRVTQTPQLKQAKPAKVKKAARGRPPGKSADGMSARNIVIAELQQGPRTREQLTEAMQARGYASTADWLISEMKKQGRITVDVDTKIVTLVSVPVEAVTTQTSQALQTA